jgi:hypothetical protein
MKGRTYGKRATRSLLLGAGACFAMAAQPGLGQEGPPAVSAQAGPSVSPPPAEQPAVPGEPSGMTVYIDPQTGAIRQDPAPGTTPLQLTPQERNAVSTSHQDLVQVPNPEPGGGVKLDLQGRFQSPLMGTIDANGKLRMQHLGDTPRSGDNK